MSERLHLSQREGSLANLLFESVRKVVFHESATNKVKHLRVENRPGSDSSHRCVGASLACPLILLCICGCAATIPGPRDVARYEKAAVLYSEHEYEEAMRLAKPLLIRFPLWSEASLIYAKSARSTGTIEGRRLASQTLSKAMAHHPHSTDLRRELASLSFEQGFLSYARSQYEALLRANDEDSEAHYMLGIVKGREWERHRDARDLSQAMAAFTRAIELDSSNVDSFRRLGLAYVEREDRDSADMITSSMLSLFPCEPEALMLRAIALHANGKYAESLKYWQEFFSVSDSVSLAPFDDISLLLTPSERAALGRLDEQSQKLFIRNFWKELDPTPITELNERVLEHWYRVGLSVSLFADEGTGTPGWQTGRGQVLIRYGMPQEKLCTASIGGEGVGVGFPTLTWSYKDEAGSFQATFFDYTLSGTYAYFGYSPLPSALDERFYRTPTSYEHDYGAEVYESLFAAAGFLRAPGVREEFYVGVPLEKVAGGDWRQVPVELAVFDTLWNEVLHVSTSLERARTFATGHAAVLVHEMGFLLFPGRYIVAAAVTDSSSGTLGMSKERIEVPVLTGDALCVSDIELAYAVPERPALSGISKDEVILPNPSGVYVAPETLRLYYEVYNLTRDTDGKHRFVAEYSIAPVKKSETSFWQFVSSIFGPGEHYVVNSLDRQVDSASSSEQIAVDISGLGEGDYTLVLRVEDLVCGSGAETERGFEKVGRPKRR